jgi:hypothetical protein
MSPRPSMVSVPSTSRWPAAIPSWTCTSDMRVGRNGCTGVARHRLALGRHHLVRVVPVEVVGESREQLGAYWSRMERSPQVAPPSTESSAPVV